jgi:hypothetical protein
MKQLILAALAVVAVAGCASYRGGAEESYGSRVSGVESPPEPTPSPTFRPGMNPQNPRDPQFVTPFASPARPVQPPSSLTF